MPRKSKKYHFIYKTTNTVNNKFYVGMHSTDDLDDGYIGSGKYLWNSIRKHGKDKFVLERLEFFEDRKLLAEREKSLVDDDLIKDPLCMNIKRGGEGGGISLPGKANGFYGKIHNPKNLITAQKNLIDSAIRRKIDPTYNYKIVNKTNNTKLNNNAGIYPTPFKGKSHSDKTKEIMRNKAKLRVGTKNSQFGTCWITNGFDNKKIKIVDLPDWLIKNWIKGRIL
jgi:hypothetical protein